MTNPRIAFRIVAFSSLLVAVMTLRFIPLGSEAAFPVLLANADASRIAFWTHILASSLALGVGVMQFLPRLRTRRPALHRWTGRVYAVSILLGGLSGLSLAQTAMPDRPVAGVGFGLLALVWIGVTGRAVLLARSGQIARHRTWMIRSFALTFAAVTLRLQLPVFFALGMTYPQASHWVAWLCWVPNLVVAEWLVRRQGRTISAPAAKQGS